MARKKKKSKILPWVAGAAGVLLGYLLYKKYLKKSTTGYMPTVDQSTFPQFSSEEVMRQAHVKHLAQVEIMRQLMGKEPYVTEQPVKTILPNGMTQDQFASYTKFLASRQKPTTYKYYSPNTLAMAFPTAEVIV